MQIVKNTTILFDPLKPFSKRTKAQVFQCLILFFPFSYPILWYIPFNRSHPPHKTAP